MAEALWAEEQARILTALGRIEGIEATTAWPREPPRKPVALVTLAGETTTDRRDDHRYLTELEYYVRVFAANSADMRRVCSAVDDAMSVLGYELTFRWEEPGEGWRQTAMRYRIYL